MPGFSRGRPGRFHAVLGMPSWPHAAKAELNKARMPGNCIAFLVSIFPQFVYRNSLIARICRARAELLLYFAQIPGKSCKAPGLKAPSAPSISGVETPCSLNDALSICH